MHALTDDQKTRLDTWSVQNKLLASRSGWKLTTTIDDEVYQKLYTTKREAEKEFDEDYDSIEKVELLAPTAKLRNIWNNRYEVDLCVNRARQVAWQIAVQTIRPDIDGFWWDDELDLYGLSAPRGMIFYHKLSEWKWS